ncbi:frataxin [Anaeramoeba flamelloides]|uniref:Frataxin n=1 Tax=Anaeramoeba flamelloides TaxID=1746091 RepID=A0AAV7ZD35_9EUKA|nr:frataxin [Anaeramoeba flamelloides]
MIENSSREIFSTTIEETFTSQGTNFSEIERDSFSKKMISEKYQPIYSEDRHTLVNFSQLAEKKLQDLLSYLKQFEQDFISYDENYETFLEKGLLSIFFSLKGNYVINKHSGTQKIWFVSPLSGNDTFFYDPKVSNWINNRGQYLDQMLENELASIIGKH